MTAVDFFGLLIPITFFALLGLEAWRPARQFPPRRGWRWLGIGFLLLIAAISTLTPELLPQDWLERHRLMNGAALGIVGGVVVGWLVQSYVNYLWHRNAHRFDFMWRGFHQIHHSPQRVDVAGSTLFHPLEMLAFALLGVAVSTLVLGLDPLAAAIVGYIAAFCGMFQHLNMHTPTWLGYVIQRPEAHCLHHARGVHAYNYADFPLWDMLFGTWRNPPSWQGEVGFETEASRRFWGMLGLRDVNTQDNGAGSLGVNPAQQQRQPAA